MLPFAAKFLRSAGGLQYCAFASLRFGERLERGCIRPSPCEGVRVGMGWVGAKRGRLIALTQPPPLNLPLHKGETCNAPVR